MAASFGYDIHVQLAQVYIGEGRLPNSADCHDATADPPLLELFPGCIPHVEGLIKPHLGSLISHPTDLNLVDSVWYTFLIKDACVGI